MRPREHRHARCRLSEGARLSAVLDYSNAVASLTIAIPPSTFDRLRYAIRSRSTPSELLELVRVTWLFHASPGCSIGCGARHIGGARADRNPGAEQDGVFGWAVWVRGDDWSGVAHLEPGPARQQGFLRNPPVRWPARTCSTGVTQLVALATTAFVAMRKGAHGRRSVSASLLSEKEVSPCHRS